MDCRPIDYARTGYFSKIITDYLAENNSLTSFYRYTPRLQTFTRIIEDKQQGPLQREILVKALTRQYSRLTGTDLPQDTIQTLQSDKTFTVTTGHQLNLFSGPLYAIYKIISTVNLAREVEKANPGYRIVPVFWMATEDHDFAEINHAHLFNETFRWEYDAKGAAGRLNPRELSDLIQRLKGILGESGQADKIYRLFSTAYLQHTTLADATRYFIHHLFGDKGLLIVDGDDPDLKGVFRPVIKADILEGISGTAVPETNEKLEQLGYKAQAHSREINFFYLDEGLRERLVVQGNGFGVLNTSVSFTREQLIQEIEQHPEKFSPNVIMRPVYQEAVLPNLAYIGGGGELAYWLQLKSTFQQHRINFPALLLRNSVLILDENNIRKLGNLDLDPAELFKPEHELVKSYVQAHSGGELSLEEEKAELEKTFQKIIQKACDIDPTLEGRAEADKTRIFNMLKGLESKLTKARKQQFETQINQLSRLKERLFPEGSLQERYDNFIPWYLKYKEAFLEELLLELDPFLNKLILFPVNEVLKVPKVEKAL